MQVVGLACPQTFAKTNNGKNEAKQSPGDSCFEKGLLRPPVKPEDSQ